MQINILDKGYVRLVDKMGDDLSIVRSARVSHGKDEHTNLTDVETAYYATEGLNARDRKLINYLWKHKHTTPFESVTVTFEVKAPIFVFRQWHRHRTQSYNEISARYTELLDEFYVPEVNVIGTQSKENKQVRILGLEEDAALIIRNAEIKQYEYMCKEAFVYYNGLLANGWPRELARIVLPVSTYSRMYTTMNLLNAFRFCTLRCDSHAQYEIRVYADAMIECLKTFVPVAVSAWMDSQLGETTP